MNWWTWLYQNKKSLLLGFPGATESASQEKEMATHSSVLALRIPGMGSHRVGHDWSDLAVAVKSTTTLFRG